MCDLKNIMFLFSFFFITHHIHISPIVLHICLDKLGQHWFRCCLVAYSSPSHYLNQCWVIVHWALSNTLQWDFNQNTKLFIHENASGDIICKMAAIFSRERWVKPTNSQHFYLPPIHCLLCLAQHCYDNPAIPHLSHDLLCHLCISYAVFQVSSLVHTLRIRQASEYLEGVNSCDAAYFFFRNYEIYFLYSIVFNNEMAQVLETLIYGRYGLVSPA